MSEFRKPKSPLRAMDPQPMRTPSPPSARGPERTKSYPGPESQQYGSQSQKYGPEQQYGSQSQKKYGPEQQYGPQSQKYGPDPQQYGSKPYNPQDYASQSYNPQTYGPQDYGSQNYPSQNYDQAYNPQDYPPVSGPQTGAQAQAGPSNNLPVRPVSGPYLPDHAGAMATMSNAQMAPTMAPTTLQDLQALKTNCQFGLREFLSLQRQRRSGDSPMSAYDLDTRIRTQSTVILSDLRTLQSEVRGIGKEAESHRWRRWIIGGAIATFIPFIRRFWRRNDDDVESGASANDTEYAFRKSKGLLEHIKSAILGRGRFAKLAFVVFAVLFVFSNEVSVRVARTTQKRLKKLCARIEQGDSDFDDKDMKVLEGWRWRILLW
ncbi:hypothetical protein FZEAL_10602 [Fusarium zealandicum]|uniref:Uncharacterized protein n=1 Tax=Fusarium zealandicum TaxID=1053134 RepID=A0A8H4TZP5_9HYPO|nr:hypothetical protein FZEAL_10602 [Fusarium zealandicum]